MPDLEDDLSLLEDGWREGGGDIVHSEMGRNSSKNPLSKLLH